MTDRLTVCDACGGDGGGEYCTGHYGGEPQYRWEDCSACGGTGQVDVFAARLSAPPPIPESFIADLDDEIPF